MAAPKGNNNAAKGKEWRDALVYSLENFSGSKKGQALRDIAKALIGKALEGDITAIKEIGDRLDGKPVQAIAGADGESPLTIQILRFADTDPK